MFNNGRALEAGTQYYSTNLAAPHVSFREALLKGLAPDGGLYMPLHLPRLNAAELEALSDKTYPALASEILGRIIGNEIIKEDLAEICNEIYTFSIPLENVYERTWLMRLDQGPTASFKDFAALLMGRLMQHFLNIDNKHITILTATSGDTGSAVANAFYGLKNIRVIILFPAGEVTEMQRKQMTTFNDNIQVIEIDGKFDDCQRLAKKTFMDSELSGLNLSSANSINIGRLLPQSVYYFRAWAQLSSNAGNQAVFSVPCGNFGNVAGGLIAWKMGLPVNRFVISTNENDEVPLFLRTGVYKAISPSRNCISSAMNVGHPSNLSRIISLYGGKMDEKGDILKSPDMWRMKKELFAVSVSDRDTRKTIEDFYRDFGKLLEPHGAVAWFGMQEYLKTRTEHNNKNLLYICLETAHPAKFREEISSVLNFKIDLPDSLSKVEFRNEEYISLANNYDILKRFIIHNY
jgi:threonine synthase